MANIIQKAKRKGQIRRMSKDQLESEIKVMKDKTVKVSDEIKKAKKEVANLEAEQIKKTKKLSDAQKKKVKKIENGRMLNLLADSEKNKKVAKKTVESWLFIIWAVLLNELETVAQ